MADDTLRSQYDRLADIVRERGERYGPFAESMRDVGKAWSAVLSQALRQDVPPLSARTVCLMFTAMKLVRCSVGGKPHYADSYDDARNYLSEAEMLHKEEPR